MRCKNCDYWSTESGERGKCEYNPPSVTLIPVQGIGGQNLSAVTFWPETSPINGCSKGTNKTVNRL